MTGPDPIIELRWNDYSLTEEQNALRSMLGAFFAKRCGLEVVRAAEPLGFARSLWTDAARAGLVGMALPESVGGDGAGLVELGLVAEEVGSAIAPIPLVDHAVATRLLAAADPGHSDLATAVDGGRPLGIAPLSGVRGGPQLVPTGAIVNGVLALQGTDLVLLEQPEPFPAVANQAAAPLAWWDPEATGISSIVLASGDIAADLWRRALGEWQAATAAALVGLASGAQALARGYSLEREAFGAPIAAFQAISHTLVNNHAAVETARNLVWRAAWYHAHEPGTRPELPAMALSHAARVATDVTSRAVHVHGGFGVTLEADISLYHRRAAVWGGLGGGARMRESSLRIALDRLVSRRRSGGSRQSVSADEPSAFVPATGSRPQSGPAFARESL